MEDTRAAIDDLFPTVLDIVVHHYVRDQSAALSYDERKRIDYRNLKAGEPVDTGSLVLGRINIEAVSEESVTVAFGRESRTLKLGEDWKIGPCVVDSSPYISSDEITMTISYYFRTAWMQIPEIMEKIMAAHENSDSPDTSGTAADEERVLIRRRTVRGRRELIGRAGRRSGREPSRRVSAIYRG